MSIRGSCHCGATRFEIDFTPTTAVRCTCTFCTKRGALWVYGRPDQFRLLSPDEGAVYSPTNPENRHHFCATCGCGTFSVTPEWTEPYDPTRRRIAISAHLFDDFEIGNLPVENVDGRNMW